MSVINRQLHKSKIQPELKINKYSLKDPNIFLKKKDPLQHSPVLYSLKISYNTFYSYWFYMTLFETFLLKFACIIIFLLFPEKCDNLFNLKQILLATKMTWLESNTQEVFLIKGQMKKIGEKVLSKLRKHTFLLWIGKVRKLDQDIWK